MSGLDTASGGEMSAFVLVYPNMLVDGLPNQQVYVKLV